MIVEILKPKSKEEVLNDFLFMGHYEFEKQSLKFMNEFGEEIPPQYRPLVVHIIEDAKKRGYWKDSLIRIKHTRIIVENSVDKKIVLLMFPFRKINELSHLKNGNSYVINNMDIYLKIIKFLENI